MRYSNWEEISLTLMKGIVKFCDKAISETRTHINSTEKTFKQKMEKKEFQKIKETISKNEEATKRVLKQKKIKNFNYMKRKPDTKRNQKTDFKKRFRKKKSKRIEEMKQQKQNRHLELTRKVTALQTIPKQRSIQKNYKRSVKEAN